MSDFGEDFWRNTGELKEANAKLQAEVERIAEEKAHLAEYNSDLIQSLQAEVERLTKLRMEDSGLEYCCSGQDCGCMGQPINPPPWWEMQNDEAIRLQAQVERLGLELQERCPARWDVEVYGQIKGSPPCPHIEQLKAQSIRYREALEFYGDRGNHEMTVIVDETGYEHGGETHSNWDGGEIARAALNPTE